MSSIALLTRRGASCSDLLNCLYDLTPVESELFYILIKNSPKTLDQLAKLIKRDRSTTHRCLQKLVSAGLSYKETKGLKEGGYYHVYSATELSKIKNQSEQKVDEVCTSLRRLIESFETDVRRHLKSVTPASPIK